MFPGDELFIRYSRAYEGRRESEMSLMDYLSACRDDPMLYASAPERLLAVPAAAAFRALRASVLVGDEAIVLSSAVARGLGVGSGDMVMVC